VSAANPRFLGVIASPIDCEPFARAFMPELTTAVAPTRGRDGCPFFYRVYTTDFASDRTLRDLNGDQLVVMKTFDSAEALQRWVDQHDQLARGER
jgi:hypothetical protein